MVVLHSTKGFHVSYMENVLKWHHGVPTAEEYEKAIEVGEEWCGRIEEGDEDYIAAMVTLGKLYGQVGMISKQKRCFRLVKDSPLFEELNAMSLSELCR
mgnify:CR=1 FL=1